MFIGFGEGPLYEAKLDEEVFPSSVIQRVFDDIGDVSETELLCGIRDLKVNNQGEVIAYKSL